MSIINEISLYQMEIPFKFSFGHGAAKRKSSDSFLLVLKTNDGKIGIGEGLPRSYVTGENLTSSAKFFEKKIFPNIVKNKNLLGLLEKTSKYDIIKNINDVYLNGIDYNPNPKETFNSIRCAAELSLLDIFLQGKKKNLSEILTFESAIDYSCILPFIPMKYLKFVLWLIKISNFNQLKVKTNGKDNEKRLEMIRNTLGYEIEVRIDGNSMYDYESFRDNTPFFKKYKIKWVEQPFLKEKHNEIVEKITQREIPLMADESLCNFKDANLIVENKLFDLFNIRISKNGGIYNSLKMVELAKKNNIGYQLGAQVGETAILSNVGRFFGYHIRPLALEGSAGTFLLKKDISKETVRFKRGGKAKKFDGIKNFGLSLNYDFLEKFGKKVFYKII